MVTKLKHITFNFENCDSITIDGKYVGGFLVDDIHPYITRVANNAIEKVETANTFAIEIHKNANVERYHHNQTHIEDFKHMTFDRFIACDITNIEFVLEDAYPKDAWLPCSAYYSYYVTWTGDSDIYNESQVNYISKDGHLYITIADGKSIENFFDLDAINDNEHMDYVWEMYGVHEGTV